MWSIHWEPDPPELWTIYKGFERVASYESAEKAQEVLLSLARKDKETEEINPNVYTILSLQVGRAIVYNEPNKFAIADMQFFTNLSSPDADEVRPGDKVMLDPEDVIIKGEINELALWLLTSSDFG
jgi:hypothetical protein